MNAPEKDMIEELKEHLKRQHWALIPGFVWASICAGRPGSRGAFVEDLQKRCNWCGVLATNLRSVTRLRTKRPFPPDPALYHFE
jgi:hypothetical protein